MGAFSNFRLFILFTSMLAYSEILCTELEYSCEVRSFQTTLDVIQVECSCKGDSDCSSASIGRQTDGMLSPMVKFFIQLLIRDITFVNNTMTKEWYNGHYPIQFLCITSQSLEFIAESAFNSIVFDSMVELQIKTAANLHLIGNIFQRTLILVHLLTLAKIIKNIHRDTMQEIRRFLYHLHLSSLANQLSFNDLFGSNSNKFGELRTIYINYEIPSSEHILASNNFSALAAIEEITLVDCGITAIESGTFDKIAFTLRILILNSNPIVTLPAMVFNRIIDSKKISEIHIQVDRKLSQCNCEVLKTVSYLILLELEEPNNYNNRICNDTSADECPDVQTIHSRKFNKKLLYARRLVFAKFILKIDVKRKELTIRTTVDDRFRMWLQVNNDHESNAKLKPCPTWRWIRARVQCIRLTKPVGIMSLNRFAVETEITRICISHVSPSPKTFLPLHCISVRWPEVVVKSDAMAVVIIQLTAIFFGIVSGFFGYLVAKTRCSRMVTIIPERHGSIYSISSYQYNDETYHQQGQLNSRNYNSNEYSEIIEAHPRDDSAHDEGQYLDVVEAIPHGQPGESDCYVSH